MDSAGQSDHFDNSLSSQASNLAPDDSKENRAIATTPENLDKPHLDRVDFGSSPESPSKRRKLDEAPTKDDEVVGEAVSRRKGMAPVKKE
jgi:hypothetical protein